MKIEEIREKAEKKVQAKLSFYICVIVFSFVTMILMILSFALPSVAFWLRLPIPVFIMVLAVIYLTAFGLPTSNYTTGDWQEEEIQKEMLKLYRQQKMQQQLAEGLTKSEKLELKELERMEEKHSWDEDIV